MINTENMSKERLTITYDGEALAKGSINLAALGPALVAANSLLIEANREIGGEDARLQVYVDSFRPGSFNIDLEVIQSTAVVVTGLFAANGVTGTLNLLQTIGFAKSAGTSLIGLYKKLAGKVPEKVEVQKDGSAIFSVIGNGNTVNQINISAEVFKLYGKQEIKNALVGLTEPLRHQGIETFVAKTNDEPVETISKEEVGYFQPPEISNTQTTTTVQRVNLTLKKFVLPPSNKSTYMLGGVPIQASITDKQFLEKVHKGEQFGMADSITVDLKTDEVNENGEIQFRYEIVAVHDHRKGMTQTNMGFQ